MAEGVATPKSIARDDIFDRCHHRDSRNRVICCPKRCCAVLSPGFRKEVCSQHADHRSSCWPVVLNTWEILQSNVWAMPNDEKLWNKTRELVLPTDATISFIVNGSDAYQ